MTNLRKERKIKLILYLFIVAISALYIGQGFLVHLRMYLINSEKISLTPINETCDTFDCTGKWFLQPAHRLLLMGHLMRTHILFDDATNQQIYPISKIRGISADSWSGLRVYSVIPGNKYRLEITKPKAVKMGYFVGVLPRSTNHEGVLSVPDISPTVSTIATLTGFGLLAILLFAAFLAPRPGLEGRSSREDLVGLLLSSLLVMSVLAITNGTIDSLMPDGELRSRILRSVLILSVVLFPLSSLLRKFNFPFILNLTCIIVIIPLIVNLNWNQFRAGNLMAITSAFMTSLISTYLYSRGYRVASLLTTIALLDSLKIFGLFSFHDYPPIYFLQYCLIASFSLVVADLGAVSVLALAAKAYQRFTRDISLNEIASILNSNLLGDRQDISDTVKLSLPKISQLTGAGKVSILINLPFGRPITHSFNAEEASFVTHDDGRIPGAVTVRAFVYGDETWFEDYSTFSSRLDIPVNQALSKAKYVCIAPIRVNNVAMGVLMLTSFDDPYIDRLHAKGEIDDEKETANLVVDALAAKFSNVVIDHMKSSASISTQLLSRIRIAIPASSSTEEFLQNYCYAIYELTGMRTMLHKAIDNKGVAITQAGFSDAEWSQFHTNPFNLNPTAQRAYGSTVVAFKERKSSYLKNWNEIRDKLHPKTVQILDSIDVCSFLAVPIHAGDDQYVVTMVSRNSEPTKDPGLMRIIETTEAIFDAAVTVFNQRTSVLALGKLANRLIGDEDVRSQIIEAAKQEQLKTTIGRPKKSFLLLFDLEGSSDLSADTEEKAISYGLFYDEVNKAAQYYLGGKVRKTIGDAVIITWDGSNVTLEDKEDLLPNLKEVAAKADSVARQAGCRGVRTVLHYGDYFFGLIGTSSFGQIDVVGKGIDEVCKIEGKMKSYTFDGKKVKIAVSNAATRRLLNIQDIDYKSNYFKRLSADTTRSVKDSDIDWICTDLLAEKKEEKLSIHNRLAS